MQATAQAPAAMSVSTTVSTPVQTVVIYHGGCPDGIAAAWCLSLAMDNRNTTYHYGRFNEKYPDVKGANVIFVDFSYDLETTLKMLQEARSVVVLDHHKSTERLQLITDPRFYMVLDMTRSGAQIAWDYAMVLLTAGLLDNYVPATKYTTSWVSPIPVVIPDIPTLTAFVRANRESRPWFINDIGDRDLWAWKIPDSKHTTKAMHHQQMYVGVNTLFNALNVSRDELISLGKILNSYEDNVLLNITRGSVDCLTHERFGKQWKCRVVGCDSAYKSDVGNLLVADGLCDFAVMYRYNMEADEWWLAVRASPKSNIDLTKILPTFDSKSAGHPKASGMAIRGVEGKSLRDFFTPVKTNFVDQIAQERDAAELKVHVDKLTELCVNEVTRRIRDRCYEPRPAHTQADASMVEQETMGIGDWMLEQIDELKQSGAKPEHVAKVTSLIDHILVSVRNAANTAFSHHSSTRVSSSSYTPVSSTSRVSTITITPIE